MRCVKGGRVSINDSLVENLEQMRLARGWSKVKLASELGLSPDTLYNIQTKRRNIGMEIFTKIVRVFPGFAVLFQRLVEEEDNG
jgi:DNA-binding XRE family transcriptional regulator